MNSTVYNRATHDNNNPYAKISLKVKYDSRLSFIHKGIMFEILSNADSFRIVKKNLQSISGLGRPAFDRAWSQLVEFGYIRKIQYGIDYQWVIFEVSENDTPENDIRMFESEHTSVLIRTSNNKQEINNNKERRDVALTCDDSNEFGQDEKKGISHKVKSVTDQVEKTVSQNSLQDGKKESSHTVTDLTDDVDKVYKAYPTVCPVTAKRTGKSSKDKIKIKSLFKTHTSDELLKIIELYVLEVKRDGFKQIKNFKTFLNNLPDYGDELETIGAHGVEGLSFAEGEKIELEKLNRLYNPSDKLIVWGITFRELGEYGSIYTSVTSVKHLNDSLKSGTAAYKFLDEFLLGGKVIKPYNAHIYSSKEYELDVDHLKIEEVENYFLERSGKQYNSDRNNYVRALLFRGEADVWLCKELIDFIFEADRGTLDSKIFAPANFTKYLDAYENKDTTVIEKEKEQRMIAEAEARARAQRIAEARAKEKAEAEKAKDEAEKAKKAQAEEKAKDIEKEKKRRLMNDAREVNQHYTKKTEKQLPDELKKAIKTAIFGLDLDSWDCIWLIDYALKHKNVSLSPELFNLSTYNSLYEESEKELTSQ